MAIPYMVLILLYKMKICKVHSVSLENTLPRRGWG